MMLVRATLMRVFSYAPALPFRSKEMSLMAEVQGSEAHTRGLFARVSPCLPRLEQMR